MMSDRPTPAHVIVVGNEKGGTGKSTTAMHVIMSLLYRGFKVAVVDLDARQKSLARYLENRHGYAARHGLTLDVPPCHIIDRSEGPMVADIERDERERFDHALDRLEREADFILIDCPGSDSHLARLAHARADTLLTPLNDSFVDLDLIGQVDPDTYQVRKLSLYSEAVWESRKQRALAGRRSLDWVVMRNRIATIDAHNKRRVDAALTQLQQRIAFRYIPGLSERVIYRELFPKGLTLVDMKSVGSRRMTMSHVAARQELRSMMNDLRLPRWNAADPVKPTTATIN